MGSRSVQGAVQGENRINTGKFKVVQGVFNFLIYKSNTYKIFTYK